MWAYWAFSIFVAAFANRKRRTAKKESPLTVKGRKIRVLELAGAAERTTLIQLGFVTASSDFGLFWRSNQEEMGGACGTYGRQERCIQSFGG